MLRETAGQIDTGKQGKRIGKINRDGIEKREKRQRGKGKIEKGELSRKKRGKAQGNRPMTTNEGEKGKHGRRKKKRGRRRQEKNKQNRPGKPPAKRGGEKAENCESVRRYENTKTTPGDLEKRGRRGREKREKDRPMLGRAKRKGKEPAGESRRSPSAKQKTGNGRKREIRGLAGARGGA